MTESWTNFFKSVKIIGGALAAVGGVAATGFTIASAVKEFKEGKNTTINFVYPKEFFLPQENPEKAKYVFNKPNPEMEKVGEVQGRFENGELVVSNIVEKKKTIVEKKPINGEIE